MGNLLQQNRTYFLLFLSWILSLTIFQALYSKAELLLWVNAHNNPVLDIFFKYYTNMGDGWMVAIAAIVLLLIKVRWAMIMVVSNILSGLCSSILKHQFFPGEPRPKTYFGDTVQLHFVEGVQIHAQNSFPSGHTITAFTIFTVLVLCIRSKRWGLLCFLLAALTAYSRMYLAQHFTADVFVGSIIGMLTAVICYIIIERSKWGSSAYLDRSLFFRPSNT